MQHRWSFDLPTVRSIGSFDCETIATELLQFIAAAMPRYIRVRVALPWLQHPSSIAEGIELEKLRHTTLVETAMAAKLCQGADAVFSRQECGKHA